MELLIVLVEAKIPENIGFVARVMKNFGFKSLCLYKCNLNEKSYITASHAKDVLNNAIILNNKREFDELLSKCNLIVCTTGVSSSDEKYLRKPTFKPNEIKVVGKTAILFGREDFGLLNEELERCHIVVTIPTSEEYPVMNISHAVAIILYEISKNYRECDKDFATSKDIEVLITNIEDMLKSTWYPKHRIRKTMMAFRRVFGRAMLTRREVLTLNGVFRKTKRYIEKLRKDNLKTNKKI
ncbi:RNA methyltransferase [Archaeoglobales archaeon]|nr:MAG: RNA methyltransferase [Archaeoglobales archaeon]